MSRIVAGGKALIKSFLHRMYAVTGVEAVDLGRHHSRDGRRAYRVTFVVEVVE